jgi:hypothetical protein
MAPIFKTIMNNNSSSLSNPSSPSSSSSSFIVRNHAIGNNPCFPYDACITTHLGDDVDILLWEQSMNCGREVLPLQVFTTIAAYHMKKQPTVIYLLSGGPTWTKSFCEQLYANSSSSSEGRDDGSSSISSSRSSGSSSSSRSSGSGSNSLSDGRRINQLRNLSDLEINLLQNDMRTNANLSHHGFLHQFRFLHDDNDDSYLAERFSNSAPMAQVSYEVMIKMMLLMIIMMVMVVAMMMMMMMMMLMVSVNKFLMLAFFTSL